MRLFPLLSSVALLASTSSAQMPFNDVHPVFLANCSGCHSTSGFGGFNIAAGNIATAYQQSQLPSYTSAGQTKGYASLVRIQSGSMPVGAGCSGDPVQDAGLPSCVTAGEQAAIAAWLADGQLAPATQTGIAFCFGDGAGVQCPCGNTGLTGGGCGNSINAQGGRLVATGAASLANDTFVLRASRLPNSSALYFQGTDRANNGFGTVFGDGLRCVQGTVIRLGTKVNAAGGSSYPLSGDQSISLRGAITTSGSVRYYQVWYRNAAAFCTASTFNLTNGVQVTWTP